MGGLRSPFSRATSRINRVSDHGDLFRQAGRLTRRPPLYTTLARPTTRVTTQRLRRLSGRDSAIATVSPTLASFCSSWARNLEVRRCDLPYSSWRTFRSTATTTVFAILSLTTTPIASVLLAMSTPAVRPPTGRAPSRAAPS